MNKLVEKMAELTGKLTPAELDLFEKCRFPYILSKAHIYLKTGPEIYHRQDAFGMPPGDWDQDDLEDVANGCRQVLDGIGFTPEKPFTGLGISGFYRLFDLFHFENTGRESTTTSDGKFLDKMIMQHVMDGSEVVYYNLVEY